MGPDDRVGRRLGVVQHPAIIDGRAIDRGCIPHVGCRLVAQLIRTGSFFVALHLLIILGAPIRCLALLAAVAMMGFSRLAHRWFFDEIYQIILLLMLYGLIILVLIFLALIRLSINRGYVLFQHCLLLRHPMRRDIPGARRPAGSIAVFSSNIDLVNITSDQFREYDTLVPGHNIAEEGLPHRPLILHVEPVAVPTSRGMDIDLVVGREEPREIIG